MDNFKTFFLLNPLHRYCLKHNMKKVFYSLKLGAQIKMLNHQIVIKSIKFLENLKSYNRAF